VGSITGTAYRGCSVSQNIINALKHDAYLKVEENKEDAENQF
jgi:hypothetical protein